MSWKSRSATPTHPASEWVYPGSIPPEKPPWVGFTQRLVSGGCKFDSCGGRKSDSRQHGLAAG